MADNEMKITINTDAGDALSTLKDVSDAFESVGGIVGKIGGLALEAAQKIKQLQNEVRQMREDFEQAAVSITRTGSALATDNLHLRDQIALLQGRPASNGLAIALQEAAARAQQLTASLRDAIVKERALLQEQSVGFMKSLFSSQEETTDLSDEFAPQMDALAQLLTQKQIAISEFNLKNDDVLQHGTEAQKKALEQQLQDLTAGYNKQLATISTAMAARLKIIQQSLIEEKQKSISDLTHPPEVQVSPDGPSSVSEALSQAEAQKQVNEQYRTRQTVIDSLRVSLLGLMQAENAESTNLSLQFTAAHLQQARQTEVITLQAQKDKIQAVHEGNQREIDDDKTTFAAINAATQQFNTQQLAILMTGINQNSNQVIKASQKYFKALEDDEAKSLARRRKMFDDFFKGVSGAFNSFISGMMKGNETFSQAWAKLVDQMAAKFLEGLEKQLMSFLEHKLMEISIHAEAEQTKDEVSAASHAKEGERSAATAAQHAYEWASEWGGPAAGAAAAVIAFAADTAFGSAEGGQYLVPSDQLTMLHRNEMVLPAGVADRMRGVIEGGGGQNSPLQIHFNMATVDGESGAAFIRRNSRNIAAAVAREMQKKGIFSR